MVTWNIFSDKGSSSEWDQLLMSCEDYTIFQSHAWGEYRKSLGWMPVRMYSKNKDGSIGAVAQVLCKKMPFHAVVIWVPGGPCGNPELLDQEFREEIKKYLNCRYIYIRIQSRRARSSDQVLQLMSQGWSECSKFMGAKLTMMLNPDVGADELKSKLGKNWYRNLNRSSRGGFTVGRWDQPTFKEVASLYRTLEEYKNLEEQFSSHELESVFKSLNQHLLVYESLSSNGTRVGIRACLIFGNKAWDFMAATVDEGRKNYVSYSVFWNLIQECGKQGLNYYDLAGVDPVSNSGVYNFKKGSGATACEYLGEWEWTNSRTLSLLVNWKINRGR